MAQDWARHEADKYTHVWSIAAYRDRSPAERVLDRALDLLSMPPGASIIDWGMGTGRAAMALQSRGFQVLGIDIAPNCPDPDCTVPMAICPIWAPPPGTLADYGFSADVLEHLPPDMVDASLQAIRRATRCAAFLQIATFPDSWDQVTGHELHLTVRPAAWWAEHLSPLWASVGCGEDMEGRPWFLCRA